MTLTAAQKQQQHEMDNKMSTTKKQLLAAVSAHKCGRSAWARGVKAYAVELVDGLNDSADLSNERLLEKELLNGAANPSELTRCKGGDRQPNSRESWIELQARALWQAASLVRRAYCKAAAIEGGAL